MKSRPYLYALEPLLILGLLFLVGFTCFQLNILGIQDVYYNSKYFRPYATLKQSHPFPQFIQLKDHRILLPDNDANGAEIFNPYTKHSEIIPGWDSISVWAKTPLLTLLADGNVLATNGYGQSDINCRKPGDHAVSNEMFCDPHKTPLMDIQHKINRWIPFPVPKMQGHSITVLPDGQLLIIGGNYFLLGKDDYAQYPPGKTYFQNNVILYNPKTYESKAIGHLQIARTMHQAELLNDHEVLVFGGMKFYSGGWKPNFSWEAGRVLSSVEAVNFKTGESRIIGNSTYPFSGQIYRINEKQFLLRGETIKNGHTISEIFDTQAGKTIALIKDINAGPCLWIAKKRLLCFGGRAVHLVDINKRTDQFVDYMHDTINNVKPFYIPNLGIIVVGTKQDFFKPRQTVVQIFNYDRFEKEFAQQ